MTAMITASPKLEAVFPSAIEPPHEQPSASDPIKIASEILDAVDRTVAMQPRPRATYRLQFHRDFTFRQATDLVPYLSDLGISDVYASPYLKAVAGSTHGYDIVDHSRLNSEVGTPEDFAAFVAALRVHQMGHILDFVPNHMGVASSDNVWWFDVLENGPGSPYAAFFDIDWHPLKPDLECKVLLPVLGDPFGRVLEDQQLTLKFFDGTFVIDYYSRRFPIAPQSFALILQHRLEELAQRLPADDPNFLEYQSVLTALSHLPPRHETDPVKLEEGQREKEIIKRRLQRLCDECPAILDFVHENVAIFNGRRGEPRSFDLLDELLRQQAYRLSYWRVAADEINYRRFFDINELAALCMERPAVFERAHTLIFQLLQQGQLDGLRIDHADGLYDPTAYLWQLQERRFVQLCQAEYERRFGPIEDGDAASESTPSAAPWSRVQAALRDRYAALRLAQPEAPFLRPLYLVVEKILERDERLPEDWPVQGSTGYEFLNDVNGLFIDGANAKALNTIYTKFIGVRPDLEQLICESKLLMMKVSMSSELHVLAYQLDRISERNRWTCDFTLHGLLQALREVVACFPVYRTYTVGSRVLDRDRRYVEQAVSRAKRHNPAISSAVFDFIKEVLLLTGADELSEDDRRQRQEFVGRFQQFTGPMMAKSVEDTTFYRFNRLVSLNEVGGDPECCGIAVEQFHQHNQDRQQRRPWAMLASSTHDSKRSEDVRARINVLSELPGEWKRHLFQWVRWNKRKKTKVDGELAPARNDEYLLYQTLIGTWPFEPPHGDTLTKYIRRIQDYMTKAVREAKVFSSWIAPNDAYERALHEFIAAILADEPLSAFRADFEPFAQQVSHCGLWNSLSQTLLKLTSPGVPDLYQGTELWDFSLVDPDNRRLVDFALRRRLLSESRASLAADFVGNAVDGRIKQFVIAEALGLRRKTPALFTNGEYLPLETRGSRQRHVCAFARRSGTAAAIVLVPRLIAELGGPLGKPPVGFEVWGDTSVLLPSEWGNRTWRNVLTGETARPSVEVLLPLSAVLSAIPVALLAAD